MKHKWVFIAMGISFLAGCGAAGSTPPPIPQDEKPGTLTGQYAFIGNPCTTEPCLPGMAYAVQVAGTDYFITVEDRWFSENRAWEDYSPEVGDWVTVSGTLREKVDVFGKPYYTIEVLSLKPAK